MYHLNCSISTEDSKKSHTSFTIRHHECKFRSNPFYICRFRYVKHEVTQSMHFYFVRNECSLGIFHWHGKGNRNDARRTGANSKNCFPSLVLNEVLEDLCKINLHLKDMSLIWRAGFWKIAGSKYQCAVLIQTIFSFVRG